MSTAEWPKATKTLMGVLLFALSIFLTVKTVQSVQNLIIGQNYHEISIEAQGTATATPDKASFSVGIYLEGANSEELTSQATTITTNIISALTALGIAKEDIKSTSYDLSPRWTWTETGGSVQDGFTLSQYYTVTVNDLALVNQAVAASSDAGATNVGSVMFELKDETALMAEARKDAVEGIYEKLAQIEESTDLNVGRAVGYYEYNNGYYYGKGGYAEGAMMEDMSATTANLEVGQTEMNLTVSMTFKVR